MPYSNAYNALKNEAYVSSRNAESINNLLYWLNKTRNYDWMPVAIKIFRQSMKMILTLSWPFLLN